MIEEPTLRDWDLIKLAAIQAMIGAISSNFRMVCLFYDENRWVLEVTLKEENSDDS